MRGVNPAHINACFPKLPGIKTPAASSEGGKAKASGSKVKKHTYPDQPGGILKKGEKSKFSGAAKEKSNPRSADPGSSKPESSNARRVTFNPESDVRTFGPLENLFSPRAGASDSGPRLRRTESMPADLAAAHAANDREPLALPPKKAHEESGLARPMTLADHLERPLTPSTPERPGVFGAWDFPAGSPTASTHEDIQPGLTRTASEVGALFGGEGIESRNPAAHTAPIPPTGEGDGRRPVGGLLSKSIGGAVLAAGTAAAITLAVELGSSGGDRH
jgi:hypothetical protein